MKIKAQVIKKAAIANWMAPGVLRENDPFGGGVISTKLPTPKITPFVNPYKTVIFSYLMLNEIKALSVPPSNGSQQRRLRQQAAILQKWLSGQLYGWITSRGSDPITGTANTGQGASRSTRSVTLPRKASNRPWRPAVGMATISAPISSATETIVSTTGPFRTSIAPSNSLTFVGVEVPTWSGWTRALEATSRSNAATHRQAS